MINFSSLTKLNFLGLEMQLEECHLRSMGNLSELRQLDLDQCSKITDEGFRYISNLPHLNRLGLRRCPLLTDQGLQALRCPGLSHLILTDNDRITDTGFQVLATMSRLHQLQLIKIGKITKMCLKSLATFPKLIEILINGCGTPEIQKIPGELLRCPKFVDLISPKGTTNWNGTDHFKKVVW